MIEVTWHASDATREQTREALEAEGSQLRDRLGFEPLTSISVVMAAAMLARILLRLYKDARYKGLIVDTTRRPIEVREMAGWSRNQVLVVSADGARLIEVGGESAASELDALTKLLEKLG